jgi:hypothetical protein
MDAETDGGWVRKCRGVVLVSLVLPAFVLCGCRDAPSGAMTLLEPSSSGSRQDGSSRPDPRLSPPPPEHSSPAPDPSSEPSQGCLESVERSTIDPGVMESGRAGTSGAARWLTPPPDQWPWSRKLLLILFNVLLPATLAAALYLLITKLLRRRKKDKYMATVQELTDAANALNSAVNRAIPIISEAGNRIDPAALDPVRDSLATTAAALVAVLPPQ